MYFLAKNPHYIEKLRKEADEIEVKVFHFYSNRGHVGLAVIFKDMNSLTSESIPFTCAILNEALRLLPPVGVNFRNSITIEAFGREI